MIRITKSIFAANSLSGWPHSLISYFSVLYLATGGSIAISEVDGSVAETYTQDIQSKCEENLLTIRYQYRKEKVSFSHISPCLIQFSSRLLLILKRVEPI